MVEIWVDRQWRDAQRHELLVKQPEFGDCGRRFIVDLLNYRLSNQRLHNSVALNFTIFVLIRDLIINRTESLYLANYPPRKELADFIAHIFVPLYRAFCNKICFPCDLIVFERLRDTSMCVLDIHRQCSLLQSALSKSARKQRDV